MKKLLRILGLILLTLWYWVKMRVGYWKWSVAVKPLLRVESNRLLWAEQLSNSYGYSADTIRLCLFRSIHEGIPEYMSRLLVKQAVKEAADALEGWPTDPYYYIEQAVLHAGAPNAK